jgi:hypothetical protein
MSALGQKRSSASPGGMSVLPSSADTASGALKVRLVPEADIAQLFDNSVGAGDDNQFQLDGLLAHAIDGLLPSRMHAQSLILQAAQPAVSRPPARL